MSRSSVIVANPLFRPQPAVESWIGTEGVDEAGFPEKK